MNKFTTNDRVKINRSVEGKISGGPITTETGIVYLVELPKSCGQIAGLSIGTVVVAEQFIEKVPVVTSVKAGDTFNDASGNIFRIIQDYRGHFLFSGLDGDLNVLYADTSKNQNEMVTFINSQSWTKQA